VRAVALDRYGGPQDLAVQIARGRGAEVVG
jgi:hypothetical protein